MPTRPGAILLATAQARSVLSSGDPWTVTRTKPTISLRSLRQALRVRSFHWVPMRNRKCVRWPIVGNYRRPRGKRAWASVSWARSANLMRSSVCTSPDPDVAGADLIRSAQYIPAKPGPIVDLTTDRVLGTHNGIWSYTIGQGARIPGMPQKMFVARKDAARNEIYVVPGS